MSASHTSGRKARQIKNRTQVLTLSALAALRASRLLEKFLPQRDAARTPFEPLEQRTLLSGSVNLDGNTLVFVGNSDGPNTMSATLQGSSIVVSVDGNSQTVNASSVNSIQVYCGNDGDTVSIDPGITAQMVCEGGNGNDYIFTGGGNSTVYGNNGNDTIIGNGGQNYFDGGEGNDSIVGGSGASDLYGDDGNDTIIGQSGNDIVGGGTGNNVTDGNGNDTIVNNTNAQSPPKAPAVGPLQAAIHMKSDTTIYAGMSVFVNGLASGLGAGTYMTTDYQWNFGDSGGQYDNLPGFTAGHMYANAGTYNITLTVTNQNGQSSSTTQQIIVLPTSDLTPIYVAPWGNDANNGSSPNDPIQSVGRANELVNNNTMVLFAAGYTYDVNGNLNINGYQNVEVSSYGSGSQPVLYYDGTSQGYNAIATFQLNSENVTFNNLTFDSMYTNGNGEPDGLNLQGGNITVSNCTFLNVTDAMDMAWGPVGVMALDDSAPNPSAERAYFAYVSGANSVFLGNNVANSVQEHVIRVDGGRQMLIYDNTLSNIGGVKDALNIQYGLYAYIANNTLTGTDQIGPLATTQVSSLANLTAQYDFAVFEDNYITDGSLIVEPGAWYVTIRNNVINGTNAQAIIVEPYDELYGREAGDISILGNTVYDSGTYGNFLTVNGEAENIVLADNLYSAPNIQIGLFHAAPVWVSDNDLSDFSQISNNVWPSNTDPNGNSIYIGIIYWSPTTYVTPQQWDSMSPVSDDLFENVDVDLSTFAIDGPSTADNYGIAIPGLFADFDGNLRPTSGLSAGAVQNNGTAPPVQTVTENNGADTGKPQSVTPTDTKPL